MSLPSGEVWIEITGKRRGCESYPSLPSGEVWIEISARHAERCPAPSHFPQGKCGLKFRLRNVQRKHAGVTSLRGSVD